MAQFDTYTNKNNSSKTDVPYLIDIQSDAVSLLETRIVAPLRSVTDFRNKALSKLHLPIFIKSEEYIIFISEMAAIPMSNLGSVVSNAADKRTEIISAIDLLFTGF